MRTVFRMTAAMIFLFLQGLSAHAEESQEPLPDPRGESSSFIDYLNEDDGASGDEGLVLYEDHSGAKLQVGGEESAGAAFKVPIG